MLRNLLLALLGIVIAVPLIALLAGIKLFQFERMDAAMTEMVMPPEPVNASPVQTFARQPRVAAVGSVVAVRGTVIKAEAEGVVREILFEAGAQVETGDPLVQLDSDIEQAQLREAQAAVELAGISLKRAQELNRSRYLAQSELDTIRANLKQAQAQVDYVQAVIAKKTVRAPFSGTLGIRQISLGQFLDKGSEIVSLQALDPIYVEFSLPQQRQGLLSRGLTVEVRADAYPDHSFSGRITAFNPDIDPATRNIRVQATLPNPDSRLRPGMFVSLEMIESHTEPVLLIPATAVQYGPYGNSVFVIETLADGQLSVRQQVVKLGTSQGDYIEVIEGVESGQQVVATGVFKLRPGMPVRIDNSLLPDFQLTPQPNNG